MDPNRKNVLWRRRFAFYMHALRGWFFIMHACCTMVSVFCADILHKVCMTGESWFCGIFILTGKKSRSDTNNVDEVFGKYPMKDFWKCATFTLTLTLKFPLTLSSYSQQMLVFFVDFQSFYFVKPTSFFEPSFPFVLFWLRGIVR